MTFESSPPHIVVACPSCRTKFAVETAAVAALETPKFHCSRCDDIFVLKDNLSASNPAGELEIRSLTRGERLPLSQAAHQAPDPVERDTPQGVGIKASDFSFGASTPLNQEPAFFSQDTALPSSSLRVSALEDSSETDRPATAAGISLLAQETIDEGSPLKAKDSPSSATSFDLPSPSSAPTRKFILSDLLPAQAEVTPATPTEAPKEPTPPPVEAPAAQETKPYRSAAPFKDRSPSVEPKIRTQDSSWRATRSQSLLSMAAPIICAFITLLGISYCARLSPQSIDSVFRFILPSFATEAIPNLPPSALGVRDLKLHFKKTKSREVIAIVSGVAINNTAKRIDGVELEALGFNERGEIVAHLRSPLRSALHGEKIEELSLETIKSYQETLNAKTSSIEPREAVPFSIALLPTEVDMDSAERPVDLARVRYFSARIFSVTGGR